MYPLVSLPTGPYGLCVFFAIGLLGGAHCLGMGGPLVTTYAARMSDGGRTDGSGNRTAAGGSETAAGTAPRLDWRDVRQHALFNLGRTLSYATMGALLGALGAVLYGEDPGGRLPVTYGHRFEEYPVAGERRYPGVDGRVHYEEGVFVGYRGFDRAGVTPMFPFGHGLSYAAFRYDDLVLERTTEGLEATVSVTNTADRPGREVVQAYVSPPDAPVDRPERELGGFAPVRLDGGERRRLTVSIPRQTYERYDPDVGWTTDPGEHAVTVGRSSREPRATERFVLDESSS